MDHLVGAGEMKIVQESGDIITTNTLGSGLGIAVHDPKTCIGGIMHVLLPTYKMNPNMGKDQPLMFVDTGIPLFFKSLLSSGASKNDLVVKVAGGAHFRNGKSLFNIGKKNLVMLHKLFQKNKIQIAKEVIGGHETRVLSLEVGTGKAWLMSNEERCEL